jgi:hypothetical protein
MYNEGSSKAVFAILLAIVIVVVAANWRACLFYLKMVLQIALFYLQPILEKWGIHLPSFGHSA